jgi:chromosome segregation ATPase
MAIKFFRNRNSDLSKKLEAEKTAHQQTQEQLQEELVAKNTEIEQLEQKLALAEIKFNNSQTSAYQLGQKLARESKELKRVRSRKSAYKRTFQETNQERMEFLTEKEELAEQLAQVEQKLEQANKSNPSPQSETVNQTSSSLSFSNFLNKPKVVQT